MEQEAILEKIQRTIENLIEIRNYILTSGEVTKNVTQSVDDAGGNQEVTKIVTLDFDSIYAKYPRKQGKSLGMKKCKAQIKTAVRFDLLNKALGNFASYHRRMGTEPQFLPHFSTFMTSWEDWLAQDAGTVRLGGQSEETTQEYLARARAREEEESWPEQDPDQVREIIRKAFQGKEMPK